VEELMTQIITNLKRTKLKSKVVKVKGKSYIMTFERRKIIGENDSWVWTQIKPYGVDMIISSYMSDNKAEGYKKGMKWLRMKGRKK